MNNGKIPKLPSSFNRFVYAVILFLVLLLIFVPGWRIYIGSVLIVGSMIVGIDYLTFRQFQKETRDRIRGDKVITKTRLNPFGKIKYENEIVDAVSESGEPIDADTPCIVLDCVKGGYLVKRDHQASENNSHANR